ncbi:MAG TPA: biotin/lipoyl-binding protein [Bryobacteraceae bacterium]|nr:biotin/lipoyl-binding protein [Bryobacteraceae bacterium]
MEQGSQNNARKWLGRLIGLAVFVGAVVMLVLVVQETNRYPRTDDANVRANFIEIAPEVNGHLVQLAIKDNSLAKKGDLLFAIDPRPYEYVLKQALSDQDSLEQQIIDYKRRIASEGSAVEAAKATVERSSTGVKTAATSIEAAKAASARARSASANAEAQLGLATNNLHRIEPLLAKQYVTIEQVDQVRTAMTVAQGTFDEAKAALAAAEAQQSAAELRQQEAGTVVTESQARLGQAVHNVDTLDTLISQRPARAAKVASARLDLERCYVVAPFDAWVTNLNISEGAYARAGVPMITLIDTRNWYVIANYRESNLSVIRNGMHVDVYLMGHPDRRFNGVVESTGFGVFPEDGGVAGGLPNIQRTLNWVHLSARFPVRVHVQNPDPTLFRIGATAVTVIR